MEQVREREEPATSSDSTGPETVTTGLGTGGGTHFNTTFYMHSVMQPLTLNHDLSTPAASPHKTNRQYADLSLAGILCSM